MRIRKITLSAILVSLGLILGVIEARIPIFTAIPGGKIGISNIVSLVSLYTLSPTATFVIAILKSLLVSFFSGAPTSFMYSGAGAFLSVLVMLFAKKTFSGRVTAVGVSILGAVSFNLAQVLVATVVVNNINVLRYLPVLCFVSAFSGLITGLATNGIWRSVKKCMI